MHVYMYIINIVQAVCVNIMHASVCVVLIIEHSCACVFMYNVSVCVCIPCVCVCVCYTCACTFNETRKHTQAAISTSIAPSLSP